MPQVSPSRIAAAETQKLDYRFAIGDQVIYTNAFGVCFGVKVITGRESRNGRPCYHYAGSDTPWFAVDQGQLQLATDEDLHLPLEALQAKYGSASDQALLEACLDGDPWASEV